MSYQVLARKWRPARFSEMVGQEHVLRALVNALDNDRLHHAYLFTGTRGVGKTTLIEQLGGWPGEGFLDLAGRGWWRSPLLSYRPREVHLGLPFEGMSESHAVFDPEWLEAPAALALGRIVLPPERRRFWQFDWRRRYLFDFLLPPPATFFLPWAVKKLPWRIWSRFRPLRVTGSQKVCWNSRVRSARGVSSKKTWICSSDTG